MIESVIDVVLIGTPSAFAGGMDSSIATRRPVDRARLTRHGFVGDRVGDPRHHGGADKAVHLYPAEHMAYWRATLGPGTPADRPGGMGENLSASGLTEECVRVGDRFRIGTALVEVSHGRQPCNTINRAFGRRDMVTRIIANGRCGLYLRVIEEGEVAAGDGAVQVAAGPDDLLLASVFAALFGPDRDPVRLARFAVASELAEAWRAIARRRLAAHGARARI